MKNCTACGTALQPSDVWCGACGTLVHEPPPAESPDAIRSAAPPVAAAPVAAPRVAAAPVAAPPVAAAQPPARPHAGVTPRHGPVGTTVYRDTLQQYFGYDSFRPGQAEVLGLLDNGDVLGVMPTGGGKSMCYVLPGIVGGGTLVVSPLIALMQDQVETLQAAGVAAAAINSTVSIGEQRRHYAAFRKGTLSLLYVAPERLANQAFTNGLRGSVRLLVADEAHCISEWGHDFRPDYLTLGATRELLGAPRTLALTATADAIVRQDIVRRLGIADAGEVLTSFDRPNLRFSVIPSSTVAARTDWLVRYARERQGQSGIVYARTRRNVEETAEALLAAGVPCAGYHAGMPSARRSLIQRQFTTGKVPVIVATNAFGLGVDKPDVRFVVHLGMPGRLESYYQEAGRAGRDGDPAECTLLYAARDASLQRRFIAQAYPSDEQVRRGWRGLVDLQQRDPQRPLASQDAAEAGGAEGWPIMLSTLRAGGLVDPASLRLTTLDPAVHIDTRPITERRRYAESRLSQMVEFAETPGCRRALVLRYFGESRPDGDCGGCDNCAGAVRHHDPAYPEDLFIALLTLRDEIASASGRPPYTVCEERTARDIATWRPRHADDLQAVWGMGATRIRWFGDRVLAVVARWEADHPDAGAAPIRPPAQRTLRRTASGRATENAPDVPFNDPLFEHLRTWRRRRAQQDGVPAYTIFTDRTARELAIAKPRDLAAISALWGMGATRVAAFGDDLLALIAAHVAPPAE